jgi:toxin ParE1/3/4
VAQALRYIDALESCCELIAENPGIGRRCDSIEPGLRRMEEGKHVIFYKTDEKGVQIIRILHANMDPERNMTKPN